MDYLKLKVTRSILEKVAAKNGLLTWYNIVKSMERTNDIEKIPPPYYVLKELTRIGFLELDPPNENTNSKYKLTKDGQIFLDSFNS